MPEEAAKSVNSGTYSLHANTSGGRIRFVTDSPYVAISAKMPKRGFMSQLTPIAMAGFDLYVGKNYYNTSLDILLGTEKKNALLSKIQKQIDNNIFQLEQGVSVERFAHAYVMSTVYEGKSIIHNSLAATAALSSNHQQQLTQHILEIGEKGEKLQHKAAQKGKLSNHSKFSSASKTLQQAHITNLKQLKQLRAQQRK